ncbi:MAG: hypothetical protein ACK4SY_07565, partial [Pyrobaculum sp.]
MAVKRRSGRIRKLVEDISTRARNIAKKASRWVELKRKLRGGYGTYIKDVELAEAVLYNISDKFEVMYLSNHIDSHQVSELIGWALTKIDGVMSELKETIYDIAVKFSKTRPILDEIIREAKKDRAEKYLRRKLAEIKREFDLLEMAIKGRYTNDAKNSVVFIASLLGDVVGDGCDDSPLCRLYKEARAAATALDYIYYIYKQLEELSTELRRVHDVEAYIMEEEAREKYQRWLRQVRAAVWQAIKPYIAEVVDRHNLAKLVREHAWYGLYGLSFTCYNCDEVNIDDMR